MRRTPSSTLFPYTTLFRSGCERQPHAEQVQREFSVLRVIESGNITRDPEEQTEGKCSDQSKRPGPRAAQNNCGERDLDRKSTRLNSSHITISYAVFCLKKK